MVMCATTAGLCLGIWLVLQGATGVAHLPTPNRALATLVLGISGLLITPRTVAAEPVPPIVRLAQPAPAETVPASVDDRYVVQRGDSLWRIAARRLGTADAAPTSGAVAAYWPCIYRANRQLIGADPNLILPGQRLVIPEPG